MCENLWNAKLPEKNTNEHYAVTINHSKYTYIWKSHKNEKHEHRKENDFWSTQNEIKNYTITKNKQHKEPHERNSWIHRTVSLKLCVATKSSFEYFCHFFRFLWQLFSGLNLQHFMFVGVEHEFRS